MDTRAPVYLPVEASAHFRPDIQALRGIAILMVLGYHAGLGLNGGFLGVDLFFVISGYVIISALQRAVTTQQFSVTAFYWKRAKRILPALFATLIATSLAVNFLFSQTAQLDYYHQLPSAAFGFSNLSLWLNTGYFDRAARLSPLLHTWSLGVEIQFYLLAPLLLLLAKQTSRLLAALTTVSLVAGLLLIKIDADACFYLLPTRLWQFTTGGLAAAIVLTKPSPQSLRIVSVLALMLLAGIAIHRIDDLHPRLDALLVTLAAFVLLHWKNPLLEAGFPARILQGVGLISYSLYLVHWPIFAIAANVYSGQPLPPMMVAGLVLASFLLAALVHRTIEQPFLRSNGRPPAVAISGMLIVVLCVGSARVMSAPADAIDWAAERRPNVGLDATCDVIGTFRPKPTCVSSKKPKLLVWGDSSAMQWAGALAESGIVQATMSTCGPMLGVSPVYTGKLGTRWAKQCIEFNDSVLAWLRTQPNITNVVLASIFIYHIEDGQELLTSSSDRVAQTPVAAADALIATIKAIQGMGKQATILAPPAIADFDVGECLERRSLNLPMIGQETCTIDRKVANKKIDAIGEMLGRVQRETNVQTIRPTALLCTSEECVTSLDGTPLYRDFAHFSYRGASLVAQRLALTRRIFGLPESAAHVD